MANHSSKEYVNGEIHVNTIEVDFSLINRSIFGMYHKVGKKYLWNYLDE